LELDPDSLIEALEKTTEFSLEVFEDMRSQVLVEFFRDAFDEFQRGNVDKVIRNVKSEVIPNYSQ
jgi:hypothetical protein